MWLGREHGIKLSSDTRKRVRRWPTNRSRDARRILEKHDFKNYFGLKIRGTVTNLCPSGVKGSLAGGKKN